MKKDVTLMYRGACGGFYAMHLLLLTGEFWCRFKGDVQDFQEIFKKQWDIQNVSRWKLTETWPHNPDTLTWESSKRKVYLKCNFSLADLQKTDTTRVVVYTDFDTQYHFAKSKQAYWFQHIDLDKWYSTTAQEWFRESYNAIRDTEWPDCQHSEDVRYLPDTIQKELFGHLGDHWTIDSFDNKDSLYSAFINIQSTIVNDELLDIGNANMYDADIVVKLQDIVNTNGSILLDSLGVKINQECVDFTNKYINLHTPEQQKYLLGHHGIKSK